MVALLSFTTCFGDPVLGDRREAVLEQLGPPRGRMQQGAVETLLYDRGLVDLTSGVVTRVKLMTDERLQQKRVAQAEADRIAAEALQQRRQLAEEAKARMLADPSYAMSSASNKFARWEQLRAEHPEVETTAEFTVLESSVAAQQQAAATLAAKPDAAEEEQPRLSSSKRRKAHRTQVEKVQEETPAPAP